MLLIQLLLNDYMYDSTYDLPNKHQSSYYQMNTCIFLPSSRIKSKAQWIHKMTTYNIYDHPNPITLKKVHFHLMISAHEQLKTKKFLNLCLTNLKIVVIVQFNQRSGLFIQLQL